MSQSHWISTRTLRALVPAVGLALALTSCSPSLSQDEVAPALRPSSSAAPENPASAEPKILDSPMPTAPVTAQPQETLSDLCGPTCSVSGVAFVEHPTWGQIRVVTMLTEGVISGTGTIAAVDVNDEVVLWSAKTGEMHTLAPAEPSQDTTGNVFIYYDPGRYNGVIVLRPTAEGFDDLQTLPGENPGGRFYYAVVQGEAEDEVSIWKYTNDGVPDYATGTVTKERFVWNGTDYVSAGPAELATGGPDEPYGAALR